LLKTNKVGVSAFVLRNKEHLAILRAEDDVIILNRIRFAEEIRPTKDLDLPAKKEIKPGELKMAVSLINQLTGKFNISKYKDTYSAELMKLIRAKAKGKSLPVPHMKVVHSKTQDLMEQLKASLGTKRKKAS